jgi:hypothetical protein
LSPDRSNYILSEQRATDIDTIGGALGDEAREEFARLCLEFGRAAGAEAKLARELEEVIKDFEVRAKDYHDQLVRYDTRKNLTHTALREALKEIYDLTKDLLNQPGEGLVSVPGDPIRLPEDMEQYTWVEKEFKARVGAL